METPEQISQWVIDNRYPKSENEKISDYELFCVLTEKIKNYKVDNKKSCFNCSYQVYGKHSNYCSNCESYSNHVFIS